MAALSSCSSVAAAAALLTTTIKPSLPNFSSSSSSSHINNSSSSSFNFPRKSNNNHHLSSSSSSSPSLFTEQLLSSSTSVRWRTRVSSFFPSFLKKGKDIKTLREELFQTITPLDRGADATPDDQQRVDQIARELEALNPVKEPLKSDFLNGKWELIYTTSRSILQTQRPKFLRSKVNYQAINVDTLRAQNMESSPFFNQVTADLMPLNPRKVAVKFDYFKILGLIPIKAPERARGELEITYLDKELRVSRGDKGNLFILKMIDPSYRVPVPSV